VPSEGQWLRAKDSDATIRVQGSTIRVQAGTNVRIHSGEGSLTKVDAKGGRIFVKVDDHSTCEVSTSSKKFTAGASEFLVDAGTQDRLYTLQGGVQLSEIKPTPVTAKTWKKAFEVALDGPDVRKRNNNRRRFTQGEENKGKRIGEDLPPSNTPTAAPETPAYTPTATPTFTPTVTPTTPPPTDNPPQVVEGTDPWPIIGGVAGLGGLIAFVVTRNNGDEQRVVGPFSP